MDGKRIRSLAKEIRESLKSQPAYLNAANLGRMRIYNAVAKRNGTLQVRVFFHASGCVLGNGTMKWLTVRPNDSIVIFACTPMEELLTTIL